MSDLFAPQMSKEMAERRPLADRLRPKNLSEVTGQEHLTGEDGVLARMIASPSVLRCRIQMSFPSTGLPFEKTLASISEACCFSFAESGL